MTKLEHLAPICLDSPDVSGGFGVAILRRLLSGLHHGRLQVQLPSGIVFEKSGQEPGPVAMIHIRRWRMLRRVVLSGDIGFADGYIEGDWTTPDLTALIRLAARNTKALAPAIRGSWPMKAFHRLAHLMNANSKRGSRRNIRAHYDLGNDFYRQWLDPSMLYSSAIWDDTTPDLETAQALKLDRIRDLLAPEDNASILEIGCGWGALAQMLAANAHVTGITLSSSQLAWAQNVLTKEIAQGHVELLFQDYRDVRGQFDRIVSIEMFEAVGRDYWQGYFDQIKACLKPGGRAVLQIISIEEDRYGDYGDQADFIQTHIFPGGFLPSLSALTEEIGKAGLRLRSIETFGLSYAETLRAWRRRFHDNISTIMALGFDARFCRLWTYYLCYCEAGFEENAIDVGLYVIEHSAPDSLTENDG